MTEGNSTISIASHDGFRKTLSDLEQLNSQVESVKSDGQGVLDALASAASVSASPGGLPGGGSDSTAPSFTEPLNAAKAAMDGIHAQLGAASSSLTNALSDLRSLHRGVTGADEGGAQGVESS